MQEWLGHPEDLALANPATSTALRADNAREGGSTCLRECAQSYQDKYALLGLLNLSWHLDDWWALNMETWKGLRLTNVGVLLLITLNAFLL